MINMGVADFSELVEEKLPLSRSSMRSSARASPVCSVSAFSARRRKRSCATRQ